jgi:hypothetical protein
VTRSGTAHLQIMDRGNRDNDPDAFHDRIQNRNRRKRPSREEETNENDLSECRPPKRWCDESSGADERNGSGDSSSRGADKDVVSIQNNDSSSNGANTSMGVTQSLSTSVAREDFGSSSVASALFATRGNPNLSRTRNEAAMLPSNTTAFGLFHPLMQAQGTFQESQDLHGLRLGYPEALGYPPSLSLQQQQQMQRALLQEQHLLFQQQKIQRAIALHASGGVASYCNSFADARMNEPSFATAGLRGGFPTASLPPFATLNQSLLYHLQLASQSSLSPHSGRPCVPAETCRSRPSAATIPSASIPDSTSQRLLGGLQEIFPSPPVIVGSTMSRTADLYMPVDDTFLSDQQIIIRKQIEFFVCGQIDIDNFSPSRQKGLSVGQVGIRCKHCADLPPWLRSAGAVYFPSTLQAIYQAGQNMAAIHLSNTCEIIDPRVKDLLIQLQNTKAVHGHGGKRYWAEGATSRGLYETERGLRFRLA